MTEERPPLHNIPKVNPLLKALASFLIWAMGWRLEGWPPDVPKMVLIGGPHTANFDVFLMLLMSWKIGFRMSWLVANDLKFPLSFLASISNGIPIDRTNPNADTVDQVIEYFNTHDKVALMIAPEGRLKRVDYWRSGFYYIAMGAKAPVVPGNMDYKRKVIALTDAFYPTGDLVADFEPLKPFFGGATARFPERVGPIEVRVRSEAMRERLKARGMRDS